MTAAATKRVPVVRCPSCEQLRTDSEHPHSPRWVVRDGKWCLVDCMKNILRREP